MRIAFRVLLLITIWVALTLPFGQADAQTADNVLVLVVPLNDATLAAGNFYTFPDSGDDVVLQAGQTGAPPINEILEASTPPGPGNVIGDTAWRTLPGTPSTGSAADNRMTLFIDPNDVFGAGAFEIQDITSFSWRTNRQALTTPTDVDWYVLEYATVNEGDFFAGGGTLSRLTSETFYAPGGNPPSNNGTWQDWSTDTVPVYEPVQAGTNFGWFGNPIRQADVAAGPIDWGASPNAATSGSTAVVDYRTEIADLIALATASAWSADLDGYVDEIIFTADNGTETFELIIDLEGEPVPDEPTIEKEFATTPIILGATTTLTFTLTNPNASPLSGLAFTDPLPTNGGTGSLTFVSTTPTTNTCTTGTGTTTVTASEIEVTEAFLAAGASCTIVLEVEADEAGTYTNTSTALTTSTIGTAFAAGTDTATDTLVVTALEADLEVAKTAALTDDVDNDTIFDTGDTVTYTVTVTNNGPEDTTNVEILDPLPADLTLVNNTPSQGTYATATGIWTVGNLANGGAATLTLEATINAGTEGNTVTNTASVNATDLADPDATNDTAEVAFTVGAADVVIVNGDDDDDDDDDGDGDTVAAAPPTGGLNIFDPSISKIGVLAPGQVGITGETLEWVLTVSNPSSVTGNNVVITDTLNNALRVEGATTTKGTTAISGQTVTTTLGNLAPAETVTIRITTTVISGVASVPNTACLTADGINELCAEALASRVDTLPATGETPAWRALLLAALVSLLTGLVVVFGVVVRGRRAA